MVIYRADSKQYELQAPKGIALYFNEGPCLIKYSTIPDQLNPGDSFVLYTDGFEAMNEKDEEWGDEGSTKRWPNMVITGQRSWSRP